MALKADETPELFSLLPEKYNAIFEDGNSCENIFK